jgi:hypothetical protein
VILAPDGQVWAPVRKAPEHFYLNPDGDLRGDGAPSAAVNPATGMPEVAWARNDDGQFDIVFSHWDGAAWTVFETVAEGDHTHLAPRLFHDGNGSRYVLWTAWKDGVSAALVSTSTVDGAFSTPKVLDGDRYEGRYPSALVVEDSIWTAHEKRDQGRRYLVLQQFGLIDPGGPSGFVPKGNEIDNPWEKAQVNLEPDVGSNNLLSRGGISSSPSGQIRPPRVEYPPSHPMVHVEDGVIWADWYQGEAGLGYAVFDGVGLDGPYFLALDGRGDLEQGRRDVRRIVIGSAGGR